MNKKYLIAILVLMLVIVGCAGTEEPTAGQSPYIGGTKGLIAEFEIMGVYNEDSNMEEIFEQEPFPIEVLLKNKGEEPITEGKATITLMGINLADFTGIAPGGVLSNDAAEIEKISQYNADGGEATLDFTSGTEDAVYNIPLTGTSYDISVFASVVYEYKTHAAVPKVCFNGDVKDSSVCVVEEQKDIYSSAAPIQVKSAEEKRSGTGKIAMEFKVENGGTGKVAKPDGNFDTRYDQIGYEISGSEDWKNNWECKSSGRINEARLDSDGKATIVCKWVGTPLTIDDVYTKQLDLTLNYKYKEIIHKQLRIRQSTS